MTVAPSRLAGVAVAGWGSALPSTRLTNADLAATLDTSDDWVRSRTGIRERRVARPGETTGPLAAEAARRALDRAGAAADEVDLVIVATCTAETPMPSTAAFVARELGCRAGGFDLDAACAGFGYALAVAGSALSSGLARRVLLVGADTMSRVVDPADRSTAVLFGDGAAALLLVSDGRAALEEPGAGVVAADLTTDVAGHGLLGIAAGGSARPASHATVDDGSHHLRMDGQELFRRVVRGLTESIGRTLARGGVGTEDVTWFAPHQANARLVEAVVARSGLDPARTLGTGDRHGNTSAASIPLSLADAADAGRLSDGDLVLVAGFGAGLSIATVLWRWAAT